MATKTPGKPFTEREQELRAAEQNVSALESQQAAEISRLEEQAGRLASQLRALRTEASKPGSPARRIPRPPRCGSGWKG